MTTPLPLTPELKRALRDYRAEAQRALLGLAYAATPAALDGPLELDLPAMPDPGGEDGLFDAVLSAPWAERVRALGVDVEVLALCELLRVERRCGGLGTRVFDRGEEGSALRRALVARAFPQGTEQLAARLEAAGATWGQLPGSLGEALTSLSADLKPRGARLRMLAAFSEDSGAARFLLEEPVAVRGAPGWGVTIRIEPTTEGAWMVIVERRWSGDGATPSPAPAIQVRLQLDAARTVERTLGANRRTLVWYESGDLGEAPMIFVEAIPSG